ncbi:MAG: hypothetical protein JWM47_1130 [Acidimicrobiales bacterium]|nr:hypothetical protein [Acidimicrobiales bacterium]
MTAGLASLAGHEARSALRRLAASLGDAWDRGDAGRWTGHFTADAQWVDGEVQVDGMSAIWDRYATNRWAEPWSIHWLTNETVRTTGSRADGTWLCLVASTIDRGATPAWSALDLTVEAVSDPTGWRIRRLVTEVRFRTPYDRGWLLAPWVDVDSGAGDRRAPADLPVPCIDAWVAEGIPGHDTDRTIQALAAEPEIRRLLAGHLRDLDGGVPGAILSERWSADGSYRAVDSGRDQAVEVAGRAAVAGVLDDEAGRLGARGRFLADQAILVDDDGARVWATDLWAGTVAGGEARWLAHRYAAKAVHEEGAWRLTRVERRRVLDCPHDSGWTAPEGRFGVFRSRVGNTPAT